jgi:hypothetical protein
VPTGFTRNLTDFVPVERFFCARVTQLRQMHGDNGNVFLIVWYKIAGGGGTSTGGVYVVSGTIGSRMPVAQ